MKTKLNDKDIKILILHHWKVLAFLNVSRKFETVYIICYKDMGFRIIQVMQFLNMML